MPGHAIPKRWQDVEELLAAGIDVFTTLNVQHLESLNDVVGGITNVRVWETVPDTVFDAADEVVLVDIPADELLARLQGRQGVRARSKPSTPRSNFFRKGNLMALRELALRRTADRVEGDVQAYRVDNPSNPCGRPRTALLTCVGPDADAERVVRAAARLAGQLNTEWHAIYVETPGLQRLPPARREKILATLEFGAGTGRDHGGHRRAPTCRERGRLRAQPQSVQARHRPRSHQALVALAALQRPEAGACSRRTSI